MKRAVQWPRYMKRKRLRTGGDAFYWTPHERDRAGGCVLKPEALGTDFEAAAARARLLNELLDAWRDDRDKSLEERTDRRAGTVDWWHHQYFNHLAFSELSPRTQQDYREALALIANLPIKLLDETGAPRRLGSLMVSSLSTQAVDKIYQQLRQGGRVNRQADYAIDVARRAWKVVRRQHLGLFLVPVVGEDGKTQRLAINPFEQVVRASYDRDTATPVTREEALAFATAAEQQGHIEIGIAALICFEWLQRPADVIAGRIAWTDYRPPARPAEVLVFHHKTGAKVWQPLEVRDGDEDDDEAPTVQLYPELERLISKLPRRGVPLLMFQPLRGPRDEAGRVVPRVMSVSHAQHQVQRIRAAAGLPAHVTLEGCRHGGMTELGDLELTEQEIMSLSGHLTPSAARLYVKRTERQRRSGALKRRKGIDKRSPGGK